MPVRVLTTVQTEVREVLHPDAVSWTARAHPDIDTGSAALVLLDEKGQKVAAYAPGCWASVEKLPDVKVDLGALAAAAEPAFSPELTKAVNEHMANMGQPPLLKPVTAEPAEGVLSEFTEPYVSVNLSVTSDNSAEVLEVFKEALRNGSLTIPVKALG